MVAVDELRMPPQDILAEQSVLGAIFIDEGKLVFVREYIEAEDFFKHAHRLIFAAMVALSERNEAIDATTMRNYLANHGDLENIGGLAYLAEVINSVPTSANAEYYAKIVSEKSNLRKLIERLTDSVNQAYDGSDDSDTIIANAEKALIDVSEGASRSGFKKIDDVLNLNFENLEARSQQTSDITGIASGYPALDMMTTGFHEEELIILAARPAVGKTAFALNVAQNIGTKLGLTVAIFSLEMGAESLVDRMLASEGVINSRSIRTGQLTDEEWQKLMIAQSNLARSSIYIDDTPGIRVTEIRSRARKLAQETGNLGLILIDYLQLITGNGRESRQQEVSEISRQLKILAKELKVPVIALSQLSRSIEQRQDKRPMLSDLRESGSIEQDADIVAFLHRDDYYHNEEEEGSIPNNTVEIIIEKNRSGARGSVELMFQKEYNKFSSISKREEG
ncbi:replicative DNA helicase [Streptococcus minor]|uniref:Replicative DNA helicase n=1 Tax=Streptococcus minor TaxID=229549 RepID=A0A3P1VAS9_9STRE|nr:replicative DNA helicase [Streptococcus minor]MDO5078021.1 replicative DNA helicase [Streptococcus minor]RRD30505.1 replicative DNA helicase [Streptococcus minor]